MTILVKFTFKHTAENTTKITQFFNEILPDTRTFDGNVSAQLYKNDQAENALVLLEVWENPACFENYISWRKEIGDFDRLGSMLTDTPAITMMSEEA